MKEPILRCAQTDPRYLRQYIDEIDGRRPEEERGVRNWRAARRSTLLLLVALFGLQYYFFDIYLTIMTLPQLSLMAALP